MTDPKTHIASSLLSPSLSLPSSLSLMLQPSGTKVYIKSCRHAILQPFAMFQPFVTLLPCATLLPFVMLPPFVMLLHFAM